MVVVTSKPWACIEVNMKETGGGNAATVYLHGDEIQVRDVLEALEKAFQRTEAKAAVEPPVKKWGRRAKKRRKVVVKPD